MDKSIVSNYPDQLLDLLVARFRPSKKKPTKGKYGYPEYRVHCPLHKDTEASLDITFGRDNHAIVWCHAGCNTAEILGAVGLSLADLYLTERRDPSKPPKPYKRRVMSLKDCFRHASIMLMTLHYYGRDVVAGVPINLTTFNQRLADLRSLSKIIDHVDPDGQDWGQYLAEMADFAAHMPHNWNEECAIIFFNEYLRLVRRNEEFDTKH